jgi:hypothetical protein
MVLSSETLKYDHESRGTRNQEWLCWRGPVAIYPTDISKNHYRRAVTLYIHIGEVLCEDNADPGSGLSWFFSVPPDKFRNSISIRPRPLPSKSSQIHNSLYRSMLYTLSLDIAQTNNPQRRKNDSVKICDNCRFIMWILCWKLRLLSGVYLIYTTFRTLESISVLRHNGGKQFYSAGSLCSS